MLKAGCVATVKWCAGLGLVHDPSAERLLAGRPGPTRVQVDLAKIAALPFWSSTMDVTATEAKNRLGQMLEHCQREPVTIEKSGRRHSVLLSAAHYDALVLASAPKSKKSDPGREFYEKYKDWVDSVNHRVEKHGLWNDGFRVW
jgi:prevent-host-death family protein